MSITDEFVAAVREYVALIENLENIEVRELLLTSARLLPQLYSLGIQLQVPQLPDGMKAETIMGGFERHSFTGILKQKLGDLDHYYGYFNPYDETSNGDSSLADDLDDIYWDLKQPLLLYALGDESITAEALWYWKFWFASGWHTAHHIVSAMCAIQEFVCYEVGI